MVEKMEKSMKVLGIFKLASVLVSTKVKHKSIPSRSLRPIFPKENHSATASRMRTVQNFQLIWLDSNINESDVDFQNSLIQLRRIVNTINTFADIDQCVDFLTKNKDEKIFMIVSGTLGQFIVPNINHLPQLQSIYVFCENTSIHKQWAKDWTEVKDVYTCIEKICDILKEDTQQCDRNSVLMRVTSEDLNRLDPSFMYTQLFKKNFLEMEYDDDAKTEFIEFCREQYHNNPNELKIIDEFEEHYSTHPPIWWYTRECFTYKMLNRALQTQDIEIIIKMSFFLSDVHRNIQELHSKMEHNGIFTVYRG